MRNTRGSTFSLCQLAKSDSSLPRYPRLPVFACHGFTPRKGGDPTPGTDDPER